MENMRAEISDILQLKPTNRKENSEDIKKIWW